MRKTKEIKDTVKQGRVGGAQRNGPVKTHTWLPCPRYSPCRHFDWSERDGFLDGPQGEAGERDGGGRGNRGGGNMGGTGLSMRSLQHRKERKRPIAHQFNCVFPLPLPSASPTLSVPSTPAHPHLPAFHASLSL